jgi:uncharacterized protein
VRHPVAREIPVVPVVDQVAAAVAVEVAVAAAAKQTDRVGIAWRPELAAGIHLHADEIDVVEVIAENYFHASRKERQALRWLANQFPLYLHGVSLGMASTYTVDAKRLDKMAKLVNEIQPIAWSEHLAFVRTPAIEIGHLAAPPRSWQVIDSTANNVHQAARFIGSLPSLENIATLVEPPGSDMSESEWIAHSINAANVPLLLDLHNLYANAINGQRDPVDVLLRYPLHRVRTVHLSGGHLIKHSSGESRLLDDHIHDVPASVFELLRVLGMCAPQALDVIIERDGAYPDFDSLLAQVRTARRVLNEGRCMPQPWQAVAPPTKPPTTHANSQSIESALARLFTDSTELQTFLADQMTETTNHPELYSIDRIGLELAAQSYAFKRSGYRRSRVAH